MYCIEIHQTRTSVRQDLLQHLQGVLINEMARILLTCQCLARRVNYYKHIFECLVYPCPHVGTTVSAHEKVLADINWKSSL